MSDKTKMHLKRWSQLLLIALVVLGLSLGGFMWHLFANHNFHIVSAGRIYRSGQMNEDKLSEVIQEQSIKSILNLRGVWQDQDWYQGELRAARKLDVQHYDFSLSAGHEVDDEQISKILETIEQAPKPMLIHCRSGSDRTGLIGALYLYNFEGKSADEAGHELTFFYGHVPYLFWRNTIAMDRTYWRYVKNHLPQAGMARAKLSGSLAKQDASVYLQGGPVEAAIH